MENKQDGQTLNNCDGCYFQNTENYYVCLINKSKLFDKTIDECPCKKCILKIICSSCCKPFLDYLHQGVINYLGHIYLIDQRIKSLVNLPATRRSSALLIIQSLIYRSRPDLIMNNEELYDIIRIDSRKQMEVSLKKLQGLSEDKL